MTVSQQTGPDAFHEFSDFVNNMLHDADGFVEAFLQEHNTLQQQEVSIFLRCIYALADFAHDGIGIDARNEDAAAKAQKIVEALGPDGWRVRFI